MVRLAMVGLWLALLLSGVVSLFWYNDWIYQLPTPIPKHYRAVPAGTLINLNKDVQLAQDKPVFLHFYNPECPCSRFNRAHFRSLVDQYGHEVNFAVVVLSDKSYSVSAIRNKIGVDIPVLFDQSIAARCGVYSTPQAVLLDSQRRLYYRGNYNSSRYCTEEKTAYAKIAITSLLKNGSLMVSSTQALKSYGCTLPVCKN